MLSCKDSNLYNKNFLLMRKTDSAVSDSVPGRLNCKMTDFYSLTTGY